MKRLRRLPIFALAALVLLCGRQAVEAETNPGVEHGRRVYQNYCAYCHEPGAGHPGTQLLQVKRGASAALVRGRRDLPAEYIRVVVRNGLIEMPPIRPSEVSDADINALVEFLHSKEAAAPEKQ